MAGVSNNHAIRVLHVVGGMNRGGAETWLMHVLRHIDRERYQFDFLVSTTRECAYDAEIRALGGHIIPCLRPSRPWEYARNFRRALAEHGPYDVIHSHVHHYSGFVLWLARWAGIRARIAHSHSNTSLLDSRARLPRRLYLRLTERLIAQNATLGLACSRDAAAALYGPRWRADRRWRVLYCGVDLEPFRAPVDRAAVRQELGIPSDSLVMGHVGRFHPPKNHLFLVEIAAEVIRREPNTRVLLVGDGPLRPAVEERVRQAGIANKVIFAGVRADVPRLMLGAMDVFVLPSLHEGLPVVGIEAQAAGLPCLLSDAVSQEADIIGSLVRRLPLDAPASHWADVLLAAPAEGLPVWQSLRAVEASPFNVARSVVELRRVYSGDPNGGA